MYHITIDFFWAIFSAVLSRMHFIQAMLCAPHKYSCGWLFQNTKGHQANLKCWVPFWYAIQHPNFSPPTLHPQLSSWYWGLKIFSTLLIKGFFFHFWCYKWYFSKHGPQQTNHCWHLIVSNFKKPLLEKHTSGSKRLKYPLKRLFIFLVGYRKQWCWEKKIVT